MNRIKLFATGSVYLLGSLLTNVINIFIIPLYTNHLSVAEFGQYNIAFTIYSFISCFATLGIYSGMCRFYTDSDDKKALKNITLTFSILWGTLFIIVGWLSASLMSSLIFSGDPKGTLYMRLIFINSVLSGVIAVFSTYFSLQYKAIKTIAIQVSMVLLTFVFSYLFIIVKKQKVEGILYAQLFANSIVLAALLLMDFKNIQLKLEKKSLKNELSYGLGLVPGQVSTWVLTLIDRYFLKAMMNLSSVGVYSLGYKIGMLIDPIFIQPFSKMFTPYKFDVYKQPDSKQKIERMFDYYNLIGWICIFVLALFAKTGVNILGTSEYREAFIIVPVIAFSYYLWGLGNFYALGLQIANKMLLNSGIAAIGAGINVLLNFGLIPLWGMNGAAIATVVAYFLMNVIYFLCGNKYYNTGLNFFKPIYYGAVFAIVYMAYLFISRFIDSIHFEIVINLILILVYLFLNVLFGFIKQQDLERVKVLVKSKLSLIRRT